MRLRSILDNASLETIEVGDASPIAHAMFSLTIKTFYVILLATANLSKGKGAKPRA